MTTIPGSQSSTTTHYDDIFNLSTTHTGAKATSESLTVALTEAVAWALLSLMTLLFIGMLSGSYYYAYKSTGRTEISPYI
jgi:hypothetical protein